MTKDKNGEWIVTGIRHFPTEHPFITNSLKFTFISLISIIITIIHSSKTEKWFLFIKNPLASEFTGISYYLLLFSPIIIVVIADFWQHWSNSDLKKIPNEGYKAVLRAFNMIVDVKLKRFNNAMREQKWPLCLEVTKPDDQIKTILTNLHNTLRFLTKNEELKVVLAEVKNSGLTGTYYTAPEGHDPGFMKDDLHGDTFFDLVLKEKKFQCHENLEELFNSSRKKRHYKFKNNIVDKGSIVGFPVIDAQQNIRYILTIKSDKTDLNKLFDKKYSGILTMFYDRLLLESNLIQIRDKYNECSKTGGNHA